LLRFIEAFDFFEQLFNIADLIICGQLLNLVDRRLGSGLINVLLRFETDVVATHELAT
jgi:hypothetical protein